jgi:hypothetical protein
MKPVSRTLWPLWALLSVLFAPFAVAQGRDDYGEIRQTVARISYISGEVSFSRGDDPDDWQPADRNVPMTLGDRVYTGSRSRLELQIHGGDSIRLGARSDLAALNLTDDTKQFAVKAGVASFQIRRLYEGELFEVDTPNAAVTFEAPGEYRVDVDDHGDTRVSVRRGSATVAAGGGQVPLDEGQVIELEGIDSPRYDIVSLSAPDGWDRWVEQRENRLASARSYQYVSADIVGADDLDEYGRWQDIPRYGRCWSPTAVAVGWTPYRVGHWIWQDPWGWTWVSAEPWGWAPYHYGRWVVVSSRWYWVPVAPRERFVAYSPALVAFVGGGPGWSASITVGGGGFVGWFPLGPRDPFQPWWGLRARTSVSTVTNVAFVNRTYVTVVNHNTFVSGGVVTSAVVRDRAVVSQVAAAPVLRGPIPIVPTAASLRVAVRADAPAALRPPAAILSRQVVARVAPPPAPPTFQAKLAVINENRGAPVAPAVAARISVENRGRPQSITTVRPAAAETGGVQLAPRGGAAQTQGARQPAPVTAFRGRPMATAQQPVAANPVTGPSAPSATGPAPREIAPRRERQPLPPAAQAPPGAPGERGRPQQTEEWRQRVQPTQAPPERPPSTLERRRIGAPPETPVPEPRIKQGFERRQQQPTPPAAAPPTNLERRRERPTASPPEQPPGLERRQQQPTPPAAAPPANLERRREQPTAPPQEQPPGLERRQQQPTPPAAAPPANLERRREQPTAPPQEQPPGLERRRERPTPPSGEPPAGVERGRERPTSPPAQPPAPAPERRREGGQPPPPPPPPPGQGAERPQVQRGRPVTPKPEVTKKKKDEEKKDERERKPE